MKCWLEQTDVLVEFATNCRVINSSRRLVIKTSLESQKTCIVVLNALENCLRFSRRPVNIKASLENQNAYSFNCTEKFVFGFQDNL